MAVLWSPKNFKLFSFDTQHPADTISGVFFFFDLIELQSTQKAAPVKFWLRKHYFIKKNFAETKKQLLLHIQIRATTLWFKNYFMNTLFYTPSVLQIVATAAARPGCAVFV